MPRRKYGHMVGACPPTPREKCRYCRLGWRCPTHMEVPPSHDKKVRKKWKRR
ncbi:MAG: hypothetical protein AB1665_00995 [Candidatus Thermoplasmatota archaeon]